MPTPFLGSHVIRLSQYTDSNRQHRLKNNIQRIRIDLETRQLSVTELQYRFSTLFYTESDEEPGWGLGMG